MFCVLFFKVQKLVSRALREQFNCNTLIIHGDLWLLSNICASHRVSYTSWTIFIFLDRVYEQTSCFDVDLAGLDNFLKNFGIFTTYYFHFLLRSDLMSFFTISFDFFRVIVFFTCTHWLLHVLWMNLQKFLTMIAQIFQPFHLIQEAALLYHEAQLLRLIAHELILLACHARSNYKFKLQRFLNFFIFNK